MTRYRRVTVRAYNLRPGDVDVAANAIVHSVVRYLGTWATEFTDAMFTDATHGTYVHTFDSDTLVTVTRTYA